MDKLLTCHNGAEGKRRGLTFRDIYHRHARVPAGSIEDTTIIRHIPVPHVFIQAI
jgi:hypothetical protein